MRQIIAACGAVFIVSVIAIDLLFLRVPLLKDLNSFLRQLSKPSFITELGQNKMPSAYSGVCDSRSVLPGQIKPRSNASPLRVQVSIVR
jgi:hypothetical protein